jgi:translocation and assembly module TamA
MVGARVARKWPWARIGQALALAATIGIVTSASAFDKVEFTVSGGDDDLTKDLRRSSLLLATQREDGVDAQDLFAAARGEYGRLVGALYAKGHYAPVIHVLVDGREAAEIAPLDAPSQIGTVQVIVDPGPVFAFSQATVAPLAPNTALPSGFATGRVAESGLIAEAVQVGVDGWRDVGHAKAAPVDQAIIADHAASTLSAEVTLEPGPRLRFGALTVTGQERMRERSIRRIAGLPEGETFSPDALDRAAERLRRTGVFRSVVLAEDEQVTSPDLIGITATVTEEKRRRYSFGAEIASLEGLTLSGYWLHRNLLGGAERLKIDGAIGNIGAQNSGIDYSLGVTLDRPATFSADTTLNFNSRIGRLDEEDYRADTFTIGLGLTRIFSNELTARVGLEYNYIKGMDEAGDFLYRNLGVPLGVNWDRRDNRTDATRGFYIDAEVKPFQGFGTTDSGVRLAFDGRVYRGLGAENRVVLAGRLQLGAVFGASVTGTPRDDLFYSGGGGTVRGQPYQSLGVDVLRGSDTITTGGTRFIAGSVEARVKVTDTIGVVGFVDAGRVSASDFFDAGGSWHAGAGLGLRYATGFGPIRLDIAAPIGGDTGKGVQVYVGIGQSF